ncbi:MoxR family ATPase [bacterium]|nr:MoxR family ATPase [bacterium]
MPGFREVSEAIVANIERVVIGKRPQIHVVLAAVLARGHVLIEDVPGVAKTMLARALAATFGAEFKRLQCTPDLLPTDATGVSVFNQKNLEFEFIRGPVFTNVLLADEINRATPRTQSALLEAMEEHQVSVDGLTHQLPVPFVVLATQNPVEQEGTFPLPEAQLDRFLVRIHLGYPDMAAEDEMLERLRAGNPVSNLKPVLNAQMLTQMQQHVANIFVDPQVKDYMLRLVRATRETSKLALGASPRASIALYRTAQALAAVEGRSYIIPDDIKRLAVPVLAHRLILQPEFRLRRESGASVVEEILNSTEVPSGITQTFRPKTVGSGAGEIDGKVN